MAVLVDLDLEFLKDVPNEGLKKIVNILVYDPEDGKKDVRNLYQIHNYLRTIIRITWVIWSMRLFMKYSCLVVSL